VNDERTKRAFNRKTDAYRIFRKMLEKGHPPNNWELLIKEAKIETTRLKKAIGEK
jgi:toxin YhaV